MEGSFRLNGEAIVDIEMGEWQEKNLSTTSFRLGLFAQAGAIEDDDALGVRSK